MLLRIVVPNPPVGKVEAIKTSLYGARVAQNVTVEGIALYGDFIHVGTQPELFLREVIALQRIYKCAAHVEVK